jgi:hypothetical protein
MSDEIAVALIGAAGTIAAAGIAACLAAKSIASEVRRARQSREHEGERDRQSRERERQKDRDARHYELRRATYGGLVENAERQGMAVMGSEEAMSAVTVEALVKPMRSAMEAHLVASKETIFALIAAGRSTLENIADRKIPRECCVAIDRFAGWSEGQMDLLLEARADLGFDRAEIAPLREAWLAHVKFQRSWLRRQVELLDAQPIAASPPSTPR